MASEPAQTVRILDNEDVESLLSMEDLIPALDDAYRALYDGAALNSPRSDVLVPGWGDAEHWAFKTMIGYLQEDDVLALRINSDLVTWPDRDGAQRRFKLPVAPDDRFLDYLFVFEGGVPVARMPEGYVQRMRVGGASGLAADTLARPDASTVGLLGSGWQAGAQLLALDEVRDLEVVEVYSTTEDRRESFAAEFDDRLDATVRAVDSPAAAAADKDVLNSATNAIHPTLDPDWFEPGMHVSSVKRDEVTEAAFRRADVTVLHTLTQITQHEVTIGDDEGSPRGGGWWSDRSLDIWDDIASLDQLVSGAATGRDDDDEITLFVNNIGMGLQFAAAGKLVVEKAREQEVGETEPLDRYTQPERYMGNQSG